MRGIYTWVDVPVLDADGDVTLDDDGNPVTSRAFRVLDSHTGKSIDVPFERGYARVNKTLYGARSAEELIMAKVVCDRNGVENVKKWLEGPVADQSATVAALEAEIVRLKALAGVA